MSFFWRDHISEFPSAPLSFEDATAFDGLVDEDRVTPEFVACLRFYEEFVREFVVHMFQPDPDESASEDENEERHILTMRLLELWHQPLLKRLRNPQLQMYLFRIFLRMERMGWNDLTDDVVRNYCTTLTNALELFHDDPSAAAELVSSPEQSDHSDDDF